VWHVSGSLSYPLTILNPCIIVSFLSLDASRSPCSSKLWGKSFHKHITNQGKGSEASKAGKYSLVRHVLPRQLPLDWRNKIILGSSSSSRKAVLKHLGWEFRQMSPDIDEKAIRNENPFELPLLIVTAKTEAIIDQLKQVDDQNEYLIITADQVVLFQDQIREKPENEAMAMEYLSSYSNHHVSTISAVMCTYYPSMRQAKNIDVATIHWGPISSSIVTKVVAKGEIYASAGGFRIEDEDLSPLIKYIEGTVDSVYGMPVEMTIQMMNDVVRPVVVDETVAA
jgi:septum formation protein